MLNIKFNTAQNGYKMYVFVVFRQKKYS